MSFTIPSVFILTFFTYFLISSFVDHIQPGKKEMSKIILKVVLTTVFGLLFYTHLPNISIHIEKEQSVENVTTISSTPNKITLI